MIRHRGRSVGRWVVVSAACAAATLAGCSSGDGTGGGAAATTESATASSAGGEPIPSTTNAVLPPAAVDDDDQGIGPPRPGELRPAGKPTACLMASVDEVGSIIGVVPTQSSEVVHLGVITCWFRNANDEELAAIGITTADAQPSPADAFATLAGGTGVSHVPGLGDDAVWAGDQLAVRIGDELVSFVIEPVAGVAAGALQSATESLAAVAMPRYVPPAAS